MKVPFPAELLKELKTFGRDALKRERSANEACQRWLAMLNWQKLYRALVRELGTKPLECFRYTPYALPSSSPGVEFGPETDGFVVQFFPDDADHHPVECRFVKAPTHGGWVLSPYSSFFPEDDSMGAVSRFLVLAPLRVAGTVTLGAALALAEKTPEERLRDAENREAPF